MNGLENVRVRFGRVDRTSVIALRGQIRFVAAQALRALLERLDGWPDCDRVIVDLHDVQLVDSTGLGLLARIGRSALERTGVRAAIVCPEGDVATCLRSAAFDELFVFVDELPFDGSLRLEDVPLQQPERPTAGALGRVMLDAHRDLADVSDQNRRAYADVIAALEAELRTAH